ncbi:MAG: S-methyl-5-thioribose kinase [bacterium]|nr:S-methyl-5-thioribose kinase [bacterium]
MAAPEYQFLTEEEVPEYIAKHPRLAEHLNVENLASVNEIGDGNLNLVFIAKDTSGRGLVLKQALPYVRMVGEGWPMTPERSRFEIQSLEAHAAAVPELVVRVLDQEPERYIFAMEDLSDHQVWRGALCKGEMHNGAAAEVGRFAGAIAFETSVFGMDRLELAARQGISVNPELCVITEDLVFTEPFVGAERNEWLAANQTDVWEFQADHRFGEAMADAKYFFMTHGEALIHGDLHTGSVMVRKPEGSDQADSVKVFDSEFAFYGPVAYDTGATWANYVIAAARAYALGEDERARWCLGLAGETWDAFEAEFRRRWPSRQDPRLWDDEFLNRLLLRWRNETWLFAAAKMSRRIIGAAKTKDIETLEPELREGAARGVLRVARSAVVERWADSTPHHFQQLAEWLLVEARTS